MGVIIQRRKRSTKVIGGINIISSFTNILERQYLPFDIYVRKAIVKFSVKKIKRQGKFSALLIKRLDIFRIINLLLWKKIKSHTSCMYNGIGQGICRNSDLLAVPNPFILIPVERYPCLDVLGLFEITWWSLFTFLVKKNHTSL